MINIDNIDFSDYYVSINYLDKFPDRNLDKWIESGNSEKIKGNLNVLVKNGGSFKTNNYTVVSSDLIFSPILYKKKDKWNIDYLETRHIHFFPSFSWKPTKSTDNGNENLSIDIDSTPNETDKTISKRKFFEIDKCENIENKSGSPKKKKRKCETTEANLDKFKIPDVPKSTNPSDNQKLPMEKPDLLSNSESEKKHKKNKSKKNMDLQESNNEVQQIPDVPESTNPGDNQKLPTEKPDLLSNSESEKKHKKNKSKKNMDLQESNNEVQQIPDVLKSTTNPVENKILPIEIPNLFSNSGTEKKHKKKSKKRRHSGENIKSELTNDDNQEQSATINGDNISKKKRKSHKSTSENNNLMVEVKLEKVAESPAEVQMPNNTQESQEPIKVKEKKHKKKKHSEIQPTEIKKERVHKKSKQSE